MEAMWINFETMNKFAIRPFVGGVNGISGEVSTGDMGSFLRRMNSLAPKQDYIVLPDQKWVDGIATSPGLVKQFIAAKMTPPRRETHQRSKVKAKSDKNYSHVHESEDDEETPTGATIEWQVTGQDAVGGVQLQIIPEFDVDNIHAGAKKDICKGGDNWYPISYVQPTPKDARSYDVLKSPQEEGLRVGDVIHVKDMKTRLKNREKLVRDLLVEAPITLTTQNVVELEIHHYKTREWIFNIHLHGTSGPATSLKVWMESFSPTIMNWLTKSDSV
jgi:hypothetical protein